MRFGTDLDGLHTSGCASMVNVYNCDFVIKSLKCHLSFHDQFSCYRPVWVFGGFLLLLIFSVYRDRKSGCHKRREERQDFVGTFDDM